MSQQPPAAPWGPPYPPPGPPVPPAPPRRRATRPFLLGLVVGLALAVLAAGAVWLLPRALGGGDLDLPDEVGGLTAADDPATYEEDPPEELLRRQRQQDGYNSRRYSEAYDGAEVRTRRYVSPDLDGPAYVVIAVRAPSSPPVPAGFDDPEVAQVKEPLNKLVEKGDVQCLVTRGMVEPADAEGDAEPSPPAVVLCQRTSDTLTVRVLGTHEPDVDDTVDATNEVWDAVS